MSIDANNLIWIDLEMTGLDPMTDRIIEVATIVTNKHLEEVWTNGILISIVNLD